MQRRGHGVIEGVHGTGREHGVAVEQAGILVEFRERLVLERLEKAARVDHAETLRYRVATGVDIERCGDRGGRVQNGGGVLFLLAQPAQQHVATQRYPRRDDRPGMLRLQSTQDPVDFGAIGEMVEARQEIHRAAAAAEMRHDAKPAARLRFGHQHACIVRVRAAFKSVEEHKERCGRVGRRIRAFRRRVAANAIAQGRGFIERCCDAVSKQLARRRVRGVRGGGIGMSAGLVLSIGVISQPVEIDEIAVRGGPSFPPVFHRRPLCEQRRHNGLRVRGGQPSRRSIQPFGQGFKRFKGFTHRVERGGSGLLKRRAGIQRRSGGKEMSVIAFHGASSNRMQDANGCRLLRQASVPINHLWQNNRRAADASYPAQRTRKTDVNAADLVHVAFSPQLGLRLRLASH